MYSTVGAVANRIGFAATPTDSDELASIESVRNAASDVVDNETGSRYVDADAENIPAAVHVATELLAVDFWRARTATRGGDIAAGVDGDIPTPSVMISVRRLLAPFRQIWIFGGGTTRTGTTERTTGGGTVIIADGSIQLQHLSAQLQRLVENPTIDNDSITILQLTPHLREQIQAGGIPAGSITTTQLAPGLVTLIENPTPPDRSVTLTKLAQDVETQVTSPTLPNRSIVIDKFVDDLQNLIRNPVPAADSIADTQLVPGLRNSIASPTPANGTITQAMLHETLNTLVQNPVPPNDSVTTVKIQNGAVTTAKIGNDQVTRAKIPNNAINADKIENGAVTTNKIPNSAINAAKIAANSISAGKISTSAVTNPKIHPDAVTTSKIKNLNVSGDKIANNAINADKIRNDAVTTTKIQNGAVTTDKIGASQVTLEKMAENSVGHHQIIEGGLTTDNYGNLTITEGKLVSAVQTKLNRTLTPTNGSITRNHFSAATQILLSPGGLGVQPADRRIFLGYKDLRIGNPITYGGIYGFRRITGASAGNLTTHSDLLTGEHTYVIRWNNETTQTVFNNNDNHIPSTTAVADNGAINLANGTWYVDVNLAIIPNPASPAGNNDRMIAAAIIYYGAEELHSSSHYFPNYHFNSTDYNSTQSRINVSGLIYDDGSSRMSVGFRVIIQGGSDLQGYYVPRANFHAIRIL